MKNNLTLNWKKCHFMVKHGIVLGHEVSKRGIEVDKFKMKLITKLPEQKCIKDIRSFLGHARFYKKFIKEFNKIARLLADLLAKDAVSYTHLTLPTIYSV